MRESRLTHAAVCGEPASHASDHPGWHGQLPHRLAVHPPTSGSPFKGGFHRALYTASCPAPPVTARHAWAADADAVTYWSGMAATMSFGFLCTSGQGEAVRPERRDAGRPGQVTTAASRRPSSKAARLGVGLVESSPSSRAARRRRALADRASRPRRHAPIPRRYAQNTIAEHDSVASLLTQAEHVLAATAWPRAWRPRHRRTRSAEFGSWSGPGRRLGSISAARRGRAACRGDRENSAEAATDGSALSPLLLPINLSNSAAGRAAPVRGPDWLAYSRCAVTPYSALRLRRGAQPAAQAVGVRLPACDTAARDFVLRLGATLAGIRGARRRADAFAFDGRASTSRPAGRSRLAPSAHVGRSPPSPTLATATCRAPRVRPPRGRRGPGRPPRASCSREPRGRRWRRAEVLERQQALSARLSSGTRVIAGGGSRVGRCANEAHRRPPPGIFHQRAEQGWALIVSTPVGTQRNLGGVPPLLERWPPAGSLIESGDRACVRRRFRSARSGDRRRAGR